MLEAGRNPFGIDLPTAADLPEDSIPLPRSGFVQQRARARDPPYVPLPSSVGTPRIRVVVSQTPNFPQLYGV